ncbi:MAG: Transposase IS200 like protein [Syntrophus sp. PtaU1.Bin208]|nr:MAG: Transposase IS200 like protein [Syntrophus sp. PtaU1.Bin208]
MARPLRIEYPGALYHVTSRGNARQNIYLDDHDCRVFLDILGLVVQRFRWLCHAYCLMPNHYHLLIETPEGNLSRGMRQLNGIYTQKFNWKRSRSGHLLQGRYKAILVDKDEYLLELSRYLMLNPVRVGIAEFPEAYAWSSYRATLGKGTAPEFLTTDWLLARFGNQQGKARRRFADFVRAGMKRKVSPWSDLKGQIYLGDVTFVENLLREYSGRSGKLQEVPKEQRYAGRQSLEELFEGSARTGKGMRNRAIYRAHVEQGYKLLEIAEFLGMHYASVSRIVGQVGREMFKCKT